MYDIMGTMFIDLMTVKKIKCYIWSRPWNNSNNYQKDHMIYIYRPESFMRCYTFTSNPRILLSHVKEWCSIMGMLHDADILIYNRAWNDYNSCQMRYIQLRNLEVVQGNIYFIKSKVTIKDKNRIDFDIMI